MSEKPNIVFIVMDTSRADNLSCYGCEDNTTPFLDSLAKRGIKYERAISQAVWTMPSHASMFTGKYQYQHRVTDGKSDNLRGLDMVQQKLSKRGYETIGVVNVPFLWPEFGFDEYFDKYDYINSDYLNKNTYLSGLKNTDTKFAKLKKALGSCYNNGGFREVLRLSNFLLKEILLLNDSGSKETNKKALNYIEQSEEPFFLFVNYLEVHGPYSPPFPYSHMFLEDKKKWLSLSSFSSVSPYADRYLPKFYNESETPDEEELNTMKNLYKGEQRYLDRRIESLYNRIKKNHPNTVFIITSDHGEAFGEHNHFEHFGSLHDEVNRVPLIEEFPEQTTKNIEYQVETRQIHDHLIDIADGKLSPLEKADYAITEYPGRDISSHSRIDADDSIFDFSQDSVSVERDGKKIIRGYSEEDIRINSDFREGKKAENVSDKLNKKAKEIIGKLEIFT